MSGAFIIGRGRAGSGIAAAIVLAALMQAAAAQGALPAGFVYLRAVDPSIVQDIRYAGSDNFVGRPLPGYEAAECILRRDVAAALKRVQADLVGSGLSLKVYDCYRPTRAVRAMAAWVNDGRSETATKRFFPKLPKSSLLRAGYIASRSRHSAGTTTAQSRQRRRHGHEFRLLRCRELHRERRHRRRTAALAEGSPRGHAQTGLCKLRS
jgi:D-alanyl-D-alanine dipeptidase